MKKTLLLYPVLFALGGCISDMPGNIEIQNALADHIDKKGCMRSDLFRQLPVPEEAAARSRQVLDAFVVAGLLKKAGPGYVPTDLGSSAYDAGSSGFCYTRKYHVRDIIVVRAEPEGVLPPAVKAAWHVSFRIEPESVSAWARTPGLTGTNGHITPTDIGKSEEFTARFIKRAGGSQLELSDPNFYFSPGMYIGATW